MFDLTLNKIKLNLKSHFLLKIYSLRTYYDSGTGLVAGDTHIPLNKNKQNSLLSPEVTL